MNKALPGRLFIASVALGFAALVAAGGCKGSKKISAGVDSLRGPVMADSVIAAAPAPPAPLPNASTASPADTAGLVDIYAPLYTPRLSWRTLSAKAKLSYEGPSESFDFSAHFRARRDSAVWISISALGGMFNVARAVVTPDSIIVVNHMHKSVSRLPMAEVGRLVPVAFDFAVLQDVLIGQPLSRAPYPSSVEDTVGSIRVWQSGPGAHQAATFAKADSTLQHLFVYLDGASPVHAYILNKASAVLPGGRFPVHRDLTIEQGSARHHLEVVFPDPPDLDGVLEMPFPIPAKYARR